MTLEYRTEDSRHRLRLLRNSFGQYPVARAVEIGTGHIIHTHNPFFDAGSGCITAKTGVIRFALLMRPEIGPELYFVGSSRYSQLTMLCHSSSFVPLCPVIVGMTVGCKCFVAGYSQPLQFPDIVRKIRSGLYLVLRFLDLCNSEHIMHRY